MITDELILVVKEHKIDDIRAYLASTINFDRTLSGEYKEQWDYCLSHGILEEEIYQSHNGKELSLEPTAENFSKLRGGLLSNFSKERIDALKIVGKTIYEKPAVSKTQTIDNSDTDSRQRTENSHPSFGAEIVIGIGAAILAGTVLGLGFKIATWKAIGGAIAIGAAATVGTKLYKSSKK